MERLKQQINFIVEIDKLKSILRRSVLMDKSRNENDAEHSWHIAMMALLLKEYANQEVDVLKVVKMLLIHDLVEIDAGDTFAYDSEGYKDKEAREQQAADRLFNILPKDQAEEIFELWNEFERRTTAEACYAAALDRLQPLLHNFYTEGVSWKEHQVTSDLVLERNSYIKDGSETLWEYARDLIEEAVDRGYMKK
ncbi:HD domain-containing protein [Pseudalkalibacillus caeni]|uniref:HD domain-containing protein n=1 Tax=Exobacillus caeni TaxID=2574798 RepID=A0A5R9F2K5_9BACL|nr:HD domain-containing protein [Pseudalkalibacillus caeni]TLS35748.1 HD domain-containing protein [Pseudalkalibacillus caeni]